MITEKRELTFIGGLAALEIQKPSMNGVAVNTVEASSLIIAKRVSILPSTRYSRIQSDDSVEYEAIAWYSNRTRDPHPFPTYKAESITGTPFNKWSLRLVFLAIAAWDRLSLQRVMNSINHRGNKNLESSVAATLGRAVSRNVLTKNGNGKSAHYSFPDGGDKDTQREYLPFWPSESAVKCIRARSNKIASRAGV